VGVPVLYVGVWGMGFEKSYGYFTNSRAPL